MKYEALPQSQDCQGLGATEVLIEGVTCLACMTPERGKHMMQVGFGKCVFWASFLLSYEVRGSIVVCILRQKSSHICQAFVIGMRKDKALLSNNMKLFLQIPSRYKNSFVLQIPPHQQNYLRKEGRFGQKRVTITPRHNFVQIFSTFIQQKIRRVQSSVK